MTSHPNRSKTNRSAKQNPTPDEIINARLAAGKTQSQAAAIVYSNLRTWQNWESQPGTERHRRMHPAIFELFKIKTGLIETDSE